MVKFHCTSSTLVVCVCVCAMSLNSVHMQLIVPILSHYCCQPCEFVGLSLFIYLFIAQTHVQRCGELTNSNSVWAQGSRNVLQELPFFIFTLLKQRIAGVTVLHLHAIKVDKTYLHELLFFIFSSSDQLLE